MTTEKQTQHTPRIYAEPSESPKLVITTNLDQNATEQNPYEQKNSPNKEEFKEFFNE
ncbi:hypothetical protein [Peribacillus asahii]|uniref:hypothetical protein n=1 Tax=Peribacillus asahii TaxID=228899 RepID=UPI00380BBF6A